MLIDGLWSDASDKTTFEVFDPSNGSLIASVASGSVEDVDRAVSAARRSFEERRWVKMPPAERAKILFAVADLIEQATEELALIDVLDNGLPLVGARRLVALGAESFRYFGGWISKIHGQTSEVIMGGAEFHAYTLREPIGVAALITPWNGPIMFACQKIAVALAAGCSVVLKPAEETPLSALALGRILMAAGVPAGVVNIVTGIGEVAGAALASHPDVNKVAFTGSTEVGREIVRAAAGNMKRVSLELGGKSPVVIFEDADLDRAAMAAAAGVFSNSGQSCIAGSRVFVHRSIHAEMIERMTAEAAKLKLGNGFADGVQMGPLISERQRARVLDLIDSGVNDGARIVTGGKAPDLEGYYIEPTILTAPRAGARILREEIFGPVMTVIPFDDVDEVVAWANDTEYGLAAAIWTRDISRAHTLAKRISAGTVWLNCQRAGDFSMPFGGYKQSGWGRENGYQGLEAYLETKSVFVAL